MFTIDEKITSEIFKLIVFAVFVTFKFRLETRNFNTNATKITIFSYSCSNEFRILIFIHDIFVSITFSIYFVTFVRVFFFWHHFRMDEIKKSNIIQISITFNIFWTNEIFEFPNFRKQCNLPIFFDFNLNVELDVSKPWPAPPVDSLILFLNLCTQVFNLKQINFANVLRTRRYIWWT